MAHAKFPIGVPPPEKEEQDADPVPRALADGADLRRWVRWVPVIVVFAFFFAVVAGGACRNEQSSDHEDAAAAAAIALVSAA